MWQHVLTTDKAFFCCFSLFSLNEKNCCLFCTHLKYINTTLVHTTHIETLLFHNSECDVEVTIQEVKTTKYCNNKLSFSQRKLMKKNWYVLRNGIKNYV